MSDVIAAISSGLVQSGIGIIRVSGDEAAAVCDKVVSLKGMRLRDAEPNRFHYAHITEGGRILDEAMVVFLKAPHSYTAENTVEIQCHGGPYLMKQVLGAVLRAGARPAEPGEFTKRAFLNGRLDLSQAEAVMSLLRSENEFAREMAMRQLRGGVSAVLQEIRRKLLHRAAGIEAALDDPEHYTPEEMTEGLEEELTGWLVQLKDMADTFDNGKMIAEGIPTAIIGRPNVGKSSLLNALLGEDRAIVTDTPGTTRDTLEERLRLGPMTLLISDTAGIRETQDKIEQIGVDRAEKKARESDLLLLVTDGSRPLTKEDRALLESTKEKKRLILVNKCDLTPAKGTDWQKSAGKSPVIHISARTGQGLSKLREAIETLYDYGEITQKPLVVTSLRHKLLLEEAQASLREAQKSMAAGIPEDLITIDLMAAYRSLGLILGEETSDDLIDAVFRDFCMGK